MGALMDFWRQVDVLAEKARQETPVWCVWETEDPDAGYALYRVPTREEAIAKAVAEVDEWLGGPPAFSCEQATEDQVRKHQEIQTRWGRPTGPVSPRRKMEEI